MFQTWIVFKIKEQQVYQISYNGCTGQDVIDAYKVMIAGEYKVREDDVKVSFDDEEIKTRIVSSELLSQTRELINQRVNQN